VRHNNVGTLARWQQEHLPRLCCLRFLGPVPQELAAPIGLAPSTGWVGEQTQTGRTYRPQPCAVVRGEPSRGCHRDPTSRSTTRESDERLRGDLSGSWWSNMGALLLRCPWTPGAGGQRLEPACRRL